MNRKEAIAEYKNRKTPRGVFAVRFMQQTPVFVDAAPDLEAARNGLLFMLRNGLHRNQQLQAAWNLHGESAFHYEVVEKLEDDLEAMTWKDLLKEKKKHWLAKLDAVAVAP